MAQLKRYLFNGFVVLLPVFITFYLIVLFSRLAFQFAGQYLRSFPKLDFPGVGIVAILGLIMIVGCMSSNVAGRYLVWALQVILQRVPIISSVYSLAKRFTDYLFSSSVQEQFKRVVLVEFPERDSYSIGFVTHESMERLESTVGEELVSVFVPMAPVPLTGFILMIPKARVKVSDLAVDDALKLVLSCGVVFPEDSSDESDLRGGRKE